ncbi:hypothetical protein [Kitasatospora viridis]|uniref:Uncharacterized protein n=1 Tax=Kitasatospora viridis TaxID=281105 RepID=A0A561SA24_9ACTN|nr:hypothetical protein [Kitasatospora viridis]TWF71726.1 hypothetical protein FHX73_1897 [Kitasatospora viridis]
MKTTHKGRTIEATRPQGNQYNPTIIKINDHLVPAPNRTMTPKEAITWAKTLIDDVDAAPLKARDPYDRPWLYDQTALDACPLSVKNAGKINGHLDHHALRKGQPCTDSRCVERATKAARRKARSFGITGASISAMLDTAEFPRYSDTKRHGFSASSDTKRRCVTVHGYGIDLEPMAEALRARGLHVVHVLPNGYLAVYHRAEALAQNLPDVAPAPETAPAAPALSVPAVRAALKRASLTLAQSDKLGGFDTDGLYLRRLRGSNRVRVAWTCGRSDGDAYRASAERGQAALDEVAKLLDRAPLAAVRVTEGVDVFEQPASAPDAAPAPVAVADPEPAFAVVPQPPFGAFATVGEAVTGPVQPRPLPRAHRPAAPACDHVARQVRVFKASPFVGVSIALDCVCRCNHWQVGGHGVATPEAVTLNEVAEHIRREGYEITGGWTAHEEGAEFPHVCYRAAVRALPEVPRIVRTMPLVGDGESIRPMNPKFPESNWWLFTTANGRSYEVSWRQSSNPDSLRWHALTDRSHPAPHRQAANAATAAELLAALRDLPQQQARAEADRDAAAQALSRAGFAPMGEQHEGFTVMTSFDLRGAYTGLLVLHEHPRGWETDHDPAERRARYAEALTRTGWQRGENSTGEWSRPAADDSERIRAQWLAVKTDPAAMYRQTAYLDGKQRSELTVTGAQVDQWLKTRYGNRSLLAVASRPDMIAATAALGTGTVHMVWHIIPGDGPNSLAGKVTSILSTLGLVKADRMPGHCSDPARYTIPDHATAAVYCLVNFSHATPVEKVRAAVAALRAEGLNARESSTLAPQVGYGYGLTVEADGSLTDPRDGLRPDTPAVVEARKVLWRAGFSRENTELGTIGHRVYPQLPAHLRDGSVNVDNTPADELTRLHDRVSVTAPCNVWADGEGEQLARALSGAHEAAFRAAGWAVEREDEITVTVLPA